MIGRALLITSLATLAGCGDDATSRSPSSAPGDGSLVADATVVAVVDGDTVDVDVRGRRERVRLTGIDTPEVAHEPSGDRPGNPAECFADEAHAFTLELLPVGTPIRLERDVVGRDDYGRLLAYVHRTSDAIFVNYEIVRQGFAQPLTIPPNVAHTDLFVEAARRAERDDVGLWSACG